MSLPDRLQLLWNCAHQSLSVNPNLSRYYVHELLEAMERSGERLSPEQQQQICRSCCSLLVAGLTATIRIEPLPTQQQHATGRDKCNLVVLCCLACGKQQARQNGSKKVRCGRLTAGRQQPVPVVTKATKLRDNKQQARLKTKLALQKAGRSRTPNLKPDLKSFLAQLWPIAVTLSDLWLYSCSWRSCMARRPWNNRHMLQNQWPQRKPWLRYKLVYHGMLTQQHLVEPSFYWKLHHRTSYSCPHWSL